MKKYIIIKNNSVEIIEGTITNSEKELMIDAPKMETLVSGNLSFYFDPTSKEINELATKLDAHYSDFDDTTIYGEVVIVETESGLFDEGNLYQVLQNLSSVN